MTTRQKVVSYKKFHGVNLKKDPMELSRTRRGLELAVAQNIDVTDTGKIRRRKGYAQTRAVANRKIWANKTLFLSVEGTDLVKLNDMSNPVTLRSDLHATNVPTFADTGLEVYYSDGKVRGKFDVNGTHTDWAVEEPANKPALSNVAGSMYSGNYEVALTYVHNDGRESSAGESSRVVVSSGGISLSGIPTPVDPDIAFVRIYRTEANGENLRLAGSVAAGTTSATITSRNIDGSPLVTQFKSPPPLGKYVAYSSGRVAVGTDRYLFFSDPFTYHLFDLSSGFLVFPEEITMVVAVDYGFYVSAGSVHFVDMKSETPAYRRVSSYPAIPGTEFHIDNSEVGKGEGQGIAAGWVAEDGIYMGGDSGQVENLTGEFIDIGSSAKGAAMVRHDQGISQIVTSVRQPSGQNLFVSDVAEATVKRGGLLEDFNVVDPDGTPIVDVNGEPVIFEE